MCESFMRMLAWWCWSDIPGFKENQQKLQEAKIFTAVFNVFIISASALNLFQHKDFWLTQDTCTLQSNKHHAGNHRITQSLMHKSIGTPLNLSGDEHWLVLIFGWWFIFSTTLCVCVCLLEFWGVLNISVWLLRKEAALLYLASKNIFNEKFLRLFQSMCKDYF